MKRVFLDTGVILDLLADQRTGQVFGFCQSFLHPAKVWKPEDGRSKSPEAGDTGQGCRGRFGNHPIGTVFGLFRF